MLGKCEETELRAKACDIAKKDPYNEKHTTAKPGKWSSAVTLWVLQQNVDGQPHSATP